MGNFLDGFLLEAAACPNGELGVPVSLKDYFQLGKGSVLNNHDRIYQLVPLQGIFLETRLKQPQPETILLATEL